MTIIGVLSGCGGAGASVFAAVLAACAGLDPGDTFLIDCDPTGGGIDVLLGCEQVPGPRWAQVRLRGGTLGPSVLRAGLPRWGEVSFLAADDAQPLDPDALGQVVDAAAPGATVVLDVARWPSPVRSAALAGCDRVVLVVPAEVRGLTASALIAAGLDPTCTAAVVRGTSRNLPQARIGQLLGLPVLAELPYDPASRSSTGLELRRVRKQTREAANAVLDWCGSARSLVLAQALPAVSA